MIFKFYNTSTVQPSNWPEDVRLSIHLLSGGSFILPETQFPSYSQVFLIKPGLFKSGMTQIPLSCTLSPCAV